MEILPRRHIHDSIPHKEIAIRLCEDLCTCDRRLAGNFNSWLDGRCKSTLLRSQCNRDVGVDEYYRLQDSASECCWVYHSGVRISWDAGGQD